MFFQCLYLCGDLLVIDDDPFDPAAYISYGDKCLVPAKAGIYVFHIIMVGEQSCADKACL